MHLLLKYDWKFKDVKGRPRNFEVGTESIADPSVELLFRGRECEVDVRMLGEGV